VADYYSILSKAVSALEPNTASARRAIAYYKERDRQRQERELKEGKEAIAREIAERNRRAGWG
jgi:hypothetical protein